MSCPGPEHHDECDNMACRKNGCYGGSPRPVLISPPREKAPVLPRPNVAASTNDAGETYVVISRDGKAKSYEIAGTTEHERIKDAVEKVIGDRHTGEWLP